MNKQTRKQISKIIDGIENVIADARDKLELYRDEIDELRDAEQDKLDNMPENLQGSERYEMTEQAVDNLDSAYVSIDGLIDYLDCDDLVSYLNDAAE